MSPEIKDSSCRDPQTGALPDTAPSDALAAITTRMVKHHRADLDSVLQRIKDQKRGLVNAVRAEHTSTFEDAPEAIAQLTLAQRDVESGIMRLGMVLKNIGATPNPYPQSYNPASPVIEKTADGIKL